MSTTPSSADERARIAEVLEQCLRWHNGDKDRDSDEAARRMAWSQHRALLQSTIASLGAAQVTAQPVAEIVECSKMGQQTVAEIDGRWKFLPYGTKLYAHPAGAAQVPSLSDDQIAETARRAFDHYWVEDHACSEAGAWAASGRAVLVLSQQGDAS